MTAVVKRVRDEALPVLVITISIGLYALFICNKTMPVSEGWYSEYAALINRGYVPYRDFDLIFPPLYAFIIAWFTSFFGYQIICLRYLGVAVFVLTAILLYGCFRIIYKRTAALPASIAAVVFLQSGNAEIFYDYIYFFNLFAYSSILLFLLFLRGLHATDDIQNISPNNTALFLFLSGMTSCLAILVKQSAGIFLLVAEIICLIGVCVCSYAGIRRSFNFIFFFLLGSAIPLIMLLIYLVANSALTNFVTCCLVGAANAKSGAVARLLTWPIDNAFTILRYLPLPIAVYIGAKYLRCHRKVATNGQKRSYFILFCLMIGLIFISIFILCYEWETFSRLFVSAYDSSQLMYGSFILIILLFLDNLVHSVRLRCLGMALDYSCVYLLSLSAFALAIGFGVIVSGGLAASQVALGTGLIIAIFTNYIELNSRYWLPILASTILFIYITIGSISTRYVSLYYWWGLSEGSIWEQNSSVDISILQGLKMSEHDAEIYSEINRYLASADSGTSIFCFPHCPIFYLFTDSCPNTRSVVQWFDVSLASSLNSDMSKIQDNKPDYLIICNVPDSVIHSHEQLFGTYWTGEMLASLNSLASSSYTELYVADLGNGYTLALYSLN